MKRTAPTEGTHTNISTESERERERNGLESNGRQSIRYAEDGHISMDVDFSMDRQKERRWRCGRRRGLLEGKVDLRSNSEK